LDKRFRNFDAEPEKPKEDTEAERKREIEKADLGGVGGGGEKSM
jgi:hypothetical protein